MIPCYPFVAITLTKIIRSASQVSIDQKWKLEYMTALSPLLAGISTALFKATLPADMHDKK
jgi:hypothetical protein